MKLRGIYLTIRVVRVQCADIISSSTTVSSISTQVSPPSISSAHVQTSSSTVTKETTATSVEAPKETKPTEAELRAIAQKIVAEDLKKWQEKFAKAADEGSDYLEEHITEITDRLIKKQAEKVGPALNIQLEEKVSSSLKDLKSTIISIVESSKETKDKEDALKTAVRKAGVGIKEKAQAVRTWRQSFDREVNSLIAKSSEDTFEILDHISDLGLQEIGMRWAWTDGITHKDWAKYHKLKTKFDEWRLEVERVVSEHVGVAKARAASEDVESKAMGTAEEAAKELARLRETGRYKISTGDTSDDWSTKVMPVAAAVVEKIKEKISEASEAIIGNSQGTAESVASVASSSVADAASAVSSAAASQVSDAQSATSDISESASTVATSILSDSIPEASESASSIVDEASNSVVAQQGTLESIISVASATASSILDQASSSIIGTPQETVESVASDAIPQASILVAEAYASVIEVAEEAPSSIESTASVVSEEASGLADEATASVSSVSSTVSEAASSLADEATASVSSISSTVSEAASEAPSSTSSSESSTSDIVSDASSTLSSVASEASSTASEDVEDFSSTLSSVIDTATSHAENNDEL